MLSNAMQDALNEQLGNELYAAHLYLSMAAYCDSINLPGFAHWMRVQFQEETGHAMKFYAHVADRDGRVMVPHVDQPPAEFGGPMAVFQEALEHERWVTGRIHGLYQLAGQEQDYAAQTFLHWFVAEQVEEEKTASQILEQVRMAAQDSAALLLLDRQLGAREAK